MQTKEEELQPLKLFIELPGAAERQAITVSPTDTLQEVRQWVLEAASSNFLTCFAIELNNKRLNEFVDLGTIPELQDGCTLRVVRDAYNDKAMRQHVRRVRELLALGQPDSFWQPSPMSVEHVSPAMLRAVTKGLERDVPEALLKPQPVQLDTFFSVLDLPKIECLKALAFDEWNPPTRARRLCGDLGYLLVTTLEGRTYHITAHTHGFYVNKSTDTTFDPRENTTQAHNCHDLVSLLKLLSSRFVDQLSALYNLVSERHLFELLSTPYEVNQWAVPDLPPSPSPARAEEAAAFFTDCDAANPGQSRDWNDELQTLRAMPTENRLQRLQRDRLLAKFQAEFVAACLRGAQVVVHGNAPPLNPMEEPRLRMYLWNNIFFSFAQDGRGVFKDQGGDAAAHAAAGADLRGIQAYLAAGSPELCVLATCVVDYAGHRVVAQAIVPGILRRDQTSTIIHGLLDLTDVGEGCTILCDEKLNELLGKAAESLHIKAHKIRSPDEKEVSLNASAECKGMRGTDNRLYVLDLFRTTPRDPNYVVGPDSRHGVYAFRNELVAAFYEAERTKIVRANITELKAQAQAQAQAKAAEEGKTLAADAPVVVSAVALQKASEVSLTVAFNPDVFTPFTPADAAEEVAADEAAVRGLASFLVDSVIPEFLQDLLANNVTVLDGLALTEAMHVRGISMRYLGLLLEKLKAQPSAPPPHLEKLLLLEMVARAAKFLLRRTLADTPVEWLSTAIAHFLNCLLGHCVAAPSWATFTQSRGHAFGSKRRNNKHLNPPGGISELTTGALWRELAQVVKLHFRYKLPETAAALLKPNRLALLRAVCRKTGVQVFTRNYNFASETPFTPADVAGLVPLAKAAQPTSQEAQVLLERAQLTISSNPSQAYALLDEAATLFGNVHGLLHESAALCLRFMALMFFQSEDLPQAIDNMERATLAMERVCGVDHPTLVRFYLQMATFYNAAGLSARALACLYHARHLVCLAFGDDHPETVFLEHNIGIVLLQSNHADASLALFKKSLGEHERSHGAGLETAVCRELMARAAHASGDLRGALEYQRQAATEFAQKLGQGDRRTQEADAQVKAYLGDVLKLETMKQRMSKARTQPLSATTSPRRGGGGASAAVAARSQLQSVDELVDFIEGREGKRAGGKKKAKGKN